MLGERLQYLRLEKGMTQKELSKVFIGIIENNTVL